MAQEPVLTSPKISIIVPVYKVEKYLRRCLDSIVVQTFTDWECILIDDGSPDNSGAICDEYAAKDKRFSVIHQENAGVSAARNAGLDVARGEWITFIDSDDWIEPDAYETALNSAVSENVDVVCFGVQCVRNGGKVKKCSFNDKKIYNNFRLYPIYMNCIWNKLFSKAFLLKTGIRFRTDLSVGEDLLFSFCTLTQASKVKYLNNTFYNYFENPNSVTNGKKTNKNIQDNYQTNKYIIEYCQFLPKTNDLKKFLYYRNAIAVIPYLIEPCFFNIAEFKEKTFSWNIWTYTFRPDFFILTLSVFLKINSIPVLYISVKKFLKR